MLTRQKQIFKFTPYIITAIIFLLIGFFIGFKYNQNDLEEITKISKSEQRVLQGALPAIEALNSQYDSCIDAYRVLSSCISDRTRCNLEDARTELTRLETQRKEADDMLLKQSSVLEEMLKSLK